MRNFRSEVFKRAYQIAKATNKCFAVCLSKAWQLYALMKKMKTQAVTFYYEKKDGSLRKAKGTLQVEYQNKTDKPKNTAVFTYYDLEAKGFRAFQIQNLIKVS